jgi:FkbM family methyltransferase
MTWTVNKFLGNIICWFIPNKKNKKHFRKKHIKLTTLGRLQKSVDSINRNINDLMIKASSVDDIYDIEGIKFFLHQYPSDNISRCMVRQRCIWEKDILEKLKVNSYDVIFDIGANIGTHSIWWAFNKNAKEIHVFEPILKTYNILKKNVDINNLKDIFKINNVGLGEKEERAMVSFADQLRNYIINSGTASLKSVEDNAIANNTVQIITLDKYISNNFTGKKINLIKIDVEGFEYKVLLGAKETLTKFSPDILIEIHEFLYKETKDDRFFDLIKKVDGLLNEYGYKMVEELSSMNFLYRKK